MGSPLVTVQVNGMRQLQANLVAFGSDKIVGRIIRASLAAGGRIARTRAAANARAMGLGFQGIVRDKQLRESPRYGRIPRSLKVGRAYIPKGDANTYRLNVNARSQNTKGIFKNKAPHAHLIEYGFTARNGHRVAGRPFLGPALESTVVQVTEAIRNTMAKRIDAENFKL